MPILPDTFAEALKTLPNVESVEPIKEKSDFKGTTLTLKVKYENFEQHTHSITGDKVLRTKDDILPLAKRLLKDVALGNHYVRLIGLSVSNPPRPESQRKWIELELEFEPWD